MRLFGEPLDGLEHQEKQLSAEAVTTGAARGLVCRANHRTQARKSLPAATAFVVGAHRNMSESFGRSLTLWHALLWVARLTGTAAIVPLMLIVFGEPGSGPAGAREWAYLALFPFGFSAGYLLGWRWPLLAGCVSLSCMAASQVVLGRAFGWGPYLVWGALCVPGALYILAGWKLRAVAGGVSAAAAG
jgi:hypothetical protein